MADQHNIFNEISDLVGWVNESILFETKSKDNINSTNKKIIKRYNYPDKKTLCKRERTKHIISR